MQLLFELLMYVQLVCLLPGPPSSSYTAVLELITDILESLASLAALAALIQAQPFRHWALALSNLFTHVNRFAFHTRQTKEKKSKMERKKKKTTHIRMVKLKFEYCGFVWNEFENKCSIIFAFFCLRSTTIF